MMWRKVSRAAAVAGLVVTAGCRGWGGSGREPAVPAVAAAPPDAAHKDVVGPHGDHTPRHGGLVLMNGDVHYEVVLARDGRHQIWFSDAVRSDLPASVAAGVTMDIRRPGGPVETVSFAIDDTGEAWIASGRPFDGEGGMVTVRYALQGTGHEIEIPVTPAILR